MSEDAETVIRAAQHALIHGGQFLETLPKMVLKIGKGRLWGQLKPRGREPFAEFSDFACHPLPDGLGCDIGRLIDLCKGHDKAVKFLEAQRGREDGGTKNYDGESVPGKVKPGRPAASKNLSNRKNIQKGGTGAEYLLRRLARLGDDWMDRYEAGEFTSVRQAAIAAGIVKVPSQLAQLQKLWGKASDRDRVLFILACDVQEFVRRMERGEFRKEAKDGR
jgi:hypothetical protein